MSKILFVFLTFCLSFADLSHKFELRKDEWARVQMIRMDKQEFFDFRWTLFDHTNIIVHSFYNKFVRHMTMSLMQGRRAYYQPIFPDFYTYGLDRAGLYIYFVDFKNDMAIFEVKIVDKDNNIKVNFISQKEENNERN